MNHESYLSTPMELMSSTWFWSLQTPNQLLETWNVNPNQKLDQIPKTFRSQILQSQNTQRPKRQAKIQDQQPSFLKAPPISLHHFIQMATYPAPCRHHRHQPPSILATPNSIIITAKEPFMLAPKPLFVTMPLSRFEFPKDPRIRAPFAASPPLHHRTTTSSSTQATEP